MLRPNTFVLAGLVLLTANSLFFSGISRADTAAATGAMAAGAALGYRAGIAADQNVGMPAGLLFENLGKPFLFWAELESGRLHLLERINPGKYIKRKSLPISIGKKGMGKQVEGDKKTPIGVYQMTSFLGDDQLDDFYGSGAYPVNFPNVWDRMSSRTGHGIWLHGLPKGVSSRPLLDSDGCVVIDNESIEQMDAFITAGESLLVLAKSLTWLAPGEEQSGTDVVEAIERWRTSWQANDTRAYLSNYHQDFTDTKRNLAQWKAYKTRVNKAKEFIRVDLSELSVIDYPGEENLVAVRFYQQYQSSNFNWEGWKHLLWRRDDQGQWRILYEGNG
jgi:murein L,D-transpeptidase YafK